MGELVHTYDILPYIPICIMPKSVFLLVFVCAVAVSCLPAVDDVVPESVQTQLEEVLSNTRKAPKKQSCLTQKVMKQLMNNKGKTQMIPCDDIQYYVTVPKKCSPKSRCGLIMDIHGWAMDAQWEEASDYLAKWSKEYIVVQPQEGVDKNWESGAGGSQQWDDLHKLEAFLRGAAKAFEYQWILDNKRVHVAGFSQGGFLTYNLLCRASDLICSIAPLGMPSAGKFVGGGAAKAYYNTGYSLDPSAREHKNCFVDGTGPNHMRSIMYHQGKYDCFFAESTAKNTVATIKHLYGMKDVKGKHLSKGKGVDWTRYSKGSINFEHALYDYQSSVVEMGMALQGHCFPSTLRKGQPKIGGTCGRKDGYTWGDEVLKFFRANPCGKPSHHSHGHHSHHVHHSNDGKRLGNGCPADMPHRYPHNNRCFQRVWGGKACNVDPKNDPHKHQRNDKKCRYAPRVCNHKHNDGKKLSNGCPKDMPHRYPHNNRCFQRVWGGKACNVNPKADPHKHQRNDVKCCYA